MKEFMFVFRRDLDAEQDQTSPEKTQALWKAWQDWMGNLAAHNNMGDTGKRLGTEGKVVKTNKLMTNGPYVELKESVVGYMFVYANSIEEAAELAKSCPNIMMGGTAEVRTVVAENDRS